MISTRMHGVIDYGVAALLAGLSGFRAVPGPVRAVVGGAGAYHASYSVLTDYEARVSPVISMRLHLTLDVVGGLGLCGAGLLMRGQSSRVRSLLFLAGLSELVVVALSRDTPLRGPGQGGGAVARVLGADVLGVEGLRADPGYAPLDTVKQVAQDVFIVDSLLPEMMGTVLPARLTVIRLADGSLLLHSPTRFSQALRMQLEALGPIGHLVAPNFAHWMFCQDWQQAFPDAVTWAAPGLRERAQVRKSGLRLDHDLGETAPAEWGLGLSIVAVPGGFGFREIALFHEPTRSLVLTDLVLNLEAPKIPVLLRPLLRVFGVVAPDGMPPPYLRALIKLRRKAAALAAWRLIDLRPDRVIFAHGRWFDQDATAALRRSLRWLIG